MTNKSMAYLFYVYFWQILTPMDYKDNLLRIFFKLYSFYGPQEWWPGDTPFEIAIGAILTQNTNWSNVQKAIENLKKEGILSPEGLNKTSDKRLSQLIKPSGYYNLKTKRIRAFLDFLFDHCHGSLEMIKNKKTSKLRELLLSIYGIGPETADSILLYALEKPVFVVDAYTKRVLSRHNILNHDASYEEYQNLFHNELGPDVQLYNEYHALFVKVGKDYCNPKPLCAGCPLYEK